MNEFTKRLKSLLEEKDINELVEYLELKSPTIIYQWISGIRKPRLNSLINLANYFECSLDYLLGRTDGMDKIKGDLKSCFVEQLKAVLKEKGLKQNDLVKNKLISRTNIYDWTHDDNSPNFDFILKLADYLQVSVDHLVGRE